jgi:hypothetical protein
MVTVEDTCSKVPSSLSVMPRQCCLLLLALGHAAATSEYQLTASHINGGFAVIGSLCFPALASDTVTIHATADPISKTDNQLLLFYDDQSGSFDAFGTKTVTDCSTLVNLARPVCKSPNNQNCDPGWALPRGQKETFTITINEEVPRQWYFVIANCDPKTGVASPVTISSVDISSNKGVACSTLSPQGQPDAGSAIVITLLVMLVILFSATTMMYYRKSQEAMGMGGGRSASGLMAAARSGSTYGGPSNDVTRDEVGHNNL